MGRRRKTGSGDQLIEKGFLAIFIGVGMLVAPMFAGNSPVLRPLAQALKTPAWIAILIGAVLLVIRRLASKAGIQKPQRLEPAGASKVVASGFPPEAAPPPGKRTFEHVLRERSNVQSADAPSKHLQWSEAVFRDIEWRRFEAVCERLFSQAGFETKAQSHGADGGVDIWLHSKNAAGPVAVVQCKHWLGKPVGVKELREFFGVMASKGLKRGTYATSSNYTPAALEFARENGVNALDGAGVLSLIGRRTAAQQQELLAVAYEGEYSRPTCASCGVKMIERISSRDSGKFWGCVNFPRCRTRMSARAAE